MRAIAFRSAERPNGAVPQTLHRKADDEAALIAAFRQGFGLAGLAIVQSPQRIRVAVVGPDGVGALAADETGGVRFWCRHAANAERIVASAASKLRRPSADVEPRAAPGAASPFPPEAEQALITAAERLHVVLYADEEITGQAVAAIARMEEELASLQRAGGLKSVNRSYRTYREDSSARGEKIVPYAQWLRKYKQNLIRQLAAELRCY